jgi:TolB-like protein/AraC-like DNA-binding protein/Tfp pilus assembly protein PilF
MPDFHSVDNDFINKIEGIIEENISDELFGVSELARAAGMSRSNLLRKIKNLTKISVSQYIRQVRLKKGMELLQQTLLTVSEVSYQVGFSSASYFIKCFHDYYGYPPGEVGRRDLTTDNQGVTDKKRKYGKSVVIGIITIIVLASVILLILFKPFTPEQSNTEKSIAVLPFKNDSNDSTNLYLINGLMESILDNLQKVGDLRVISRTSVEKYRNNPMTIPEIAKELNVNYFVEGSGQKIGDQILLNIQLIEAPGDRHLWSEKYNREVKDIFKLEAEIAKNIVSNIQAIITPEEENRINKIPTDNFIAYDYFLKGLDLLNKGTRDNLVKAIPFFEKAIEHDSEFARAYSAIAMAYHFLDLNQVEKKYTLQVNNYADKALFLDSQLPQGLVAKALYYIDEKDYARAVSYFEKALDYNPNYDLAIGLLADLYVNYIPNTEKYLEYALRGQKIDLKTYDSMTSSIIYLHLSNAFIQCGFTDEAELYINKSLEFNPDNLFSEYVKAYILYAKNKDLSETKKLLVETLQKDTSRYDVLIETGKICYYMRDYTSAYKYFKKYLEIKKALDLDIYRSEDGKIGLVLSKIGLSVESEKYFSYYLAYAENDNSIYKHLSLSIYYSYKGDTDKAIDELKLFSQQTNYTYWVILFLKIDPLVDNISNLSEFKKVSNDLEIKFWNNNKRIKSSLKEKGLL